MNNDKIIFNTYNMIVYNLNKEILEIIELNKITDEYNLVLSKKQIVDLINNKNNTLKEIGRIEFNNEIIKKIIYNFYDSPYIDKEEYLNILKELINIFYIYRDNFDFILSDDQIIKYMRIKFNNYCNGSLDLLLYNELEYLKNNLTEIINEL